MATWVGTITNAGAALFAQWVSGTTLNISSAKAGTGTVAEVALMAQTNLVSVKQTMSIISSQTVSDARRIKLQIEAPETGYTLNQIGLWGQIGTDTPVMFVIYQNTDGVLIPSAASSSEFSYTFYANIAVSNEGELSVTIDTAAALTLSSFEEMGVRYDEAQTLTTAQQATARSNIGAASTAVANASASGLMSAVDKAKLDGMEDGATSVDESTVSGWGFTKNTGTYSKPSTGIPATDLASAVQASLAKADSAIQAHQDISGKADLSGASFTGTIYEAKDIVVQSPGWNSVVVLNQDGTDYVRFIEANGNSHLVFGKNGVEFDFNNSEFSADAVKKLVLTLYDNNGTFDARTWRFGSDGYFDTLNLLVRTFANIQNLGVAGTLTTPEINGLASKYYKSASQVQSLTPWKDGENGISFFKYETTDVTTFDLPYNHCFIIKIQHTSTRGIAIAIPWTFAMYNNIYINGLWDTWSGWKNINHEVLSTDITAGTTPLADGRQAFVIQ